MTSLAVGFRWLVVLLLVQVVAGSTPAATVVPDRIRFRELVTQNSTVSWAVKSLVLSVSNGLKVGYFVAVSSFAGVMDFKTFGNLPVCLLPRKAVSKFLLLFGFVPRIGVAVLHY
jgi:hypothetical protein